MYQYDDADQFDERAIEVTRPGGETAWQLDVKGAKCDERKARGRERLDVLLDRAVLHAPLLYNITCADGQLTPRPTTPSADASEAHYEVPPATARSLSGTSTSRRTGATRSSPMPGHHGEVDVTVWNTWGDETLESVECTDPRVDDASGAAPRFCSCVCGPQAVDARRFDKWDSGARTRGEAVACERRVPRTAADARTGFFALARRPVSTAARGNNAHVTICRRRSRPGRHDEPAPVSRAPTHQWALAKGSRRRPLSGSVPAEHKGAEDDARRVAMCLARLRPKAFGRMP